MTASDPPPRTVPYPPPENPTEAEDTRLEEIEAQDRAAERWPAMAWALFDGKSPCKTCSAVYRARRIRCPVCGYWKVV